MAKTLVQLGLTAKGGRDFVITGLAVDSREVQGGFLFAAMPGSQVHGGEFIQYALRQGASAVLTDATGAELAKDWIEKFNPVVCISEDPRGALARAASLYFEDQPATMVAVTGTNGKTSISTFCRQLWEDMGLPAVNLGTTGVEGFWQAPSVHTTPEPITLHRLLAEASATGVTHGAMEASSHGLEQRRLDGVRLAAAGFSNFTQDHLDYHETFEAYFAAKMALFDRVLAPDAVAVVNVDDSKGDDVVAIAQRAGQSVLKVGKRLDADLHLVGQRFDATGQDIIFSWRGERFQKHLPLVGGFQGENVLLAVGMIIAAGVQATDAFSAMQAVKPVRGRMELAATRDNGASVFVDYAHTPYAVETALKALRPHAMGRIICVLGAGGDRDLIKRPLMGRAAHEFADIVFVTDDNPRSEDPASIRSMVMEGAIEANEVGDRAEAILRAVDAAGAGDIVLIAGKGHETGQDVNGTILPFDDVEQASIAAAALDGGAL